MKSLLNLLHMVDHYLKDYYRSLTWIKRLAILAYLLFAGTFIFAVSVEFPMWLRLAGLVGLVCFCIVVQSFIGRYICHPRSCLTAVMTSFDDAGRLVIIAVYGERGQRCREGQIGFRELARAVAPYDLIVRHWLREQGEEVQG